MTIGFDARFLSVPGGIPRYCRELLHHLADKNPDTKYVVLVKTIPADFPKFSNLEWLVTDVPWYGWAEQFILGNIMNDRRDVDLWHIPHWNVPITLHRPFIMTVHDFIFEEFPTHDHSLTGWLKFKLKILVWRGLMAYNIRRARAIITVSDHIKKKIVNRFPAAAPKTFVTYEAPPCAEHLPPKNTTSPAPHNKFFLAVGNSYPHKNYRLILNAYAADQTLVTPTIIVTHRDRFSTSLENEVKNRGLNHRIIFVFDSTDSLLDSLYTHAVALLFPSQEEGFGIPPLEAFSHGTPVIALKLPVLQELLSDLVWWTENLPLALAKNMHTAISNHTNEPISVRTARKNLAANFSWRETAFSTQKIYKNVL